MILSYGDWRKPMIGFTHTNDESGGLKVSLRCSRLLAFDGIHFGHIINKVADHTDPGDIPEMILGVLHTVRMSQLLQLLFDALLGFDPFLDIVDRRYGRLLIQASVEHFKLGAHDLTCVLIWLDTIVILFVCHENPLLKTYKKL